MTLSAKEARTLTEQNINDATGKLVGKIDSAIDQAIYDCKYTVTTPIVTKTQAQIITARYTELGYEVVDYHNNMLGINW